MRCLHINRGGEQCPAEAVEGSTFCSDHYTLPDSDSDEGRNRRPYIYQLAAILLLLMFLANYYQTVLQWLGR